ncbi:MAG: 1-deoxy-D-xylulose-5-phosphate reductoisomerase [Planctomycetaceae bacterium]|nr:1-deoxy-D-xylulose-5-phosphate reductoisomerase [Planctomycetaceae bacterium]
MRAATRRVFILGSTGSIGTSGLDVVRELARRGTPRFEVAGLAASRNGDALSAQASEFHPHAVALVDGDAELSVPAGTRVFRGPRAAVDMLEACARRGDLVLAAMVGAAGIDPVLAAISIGCDIALANKETLVAAGAIVMPAAARAGVRIVPVDSEHNALFQCLKAGDGMQGVRRVVLTASGGPFRAKTLEQMARATPDDALAHPTWRMGPKVTIDSASLMNKALELIEAHWLFGLGADRIDAIVHPQSIVHGFVEYLDGSVLAQLSPPDMRTPIQQAMCDPERLDGPSRKLDFAALRSLDFEPVDHARFPAILLAHEVIRTGGTAGAVLNAANEVAVHAFLARRIGFLDVTAVVRETLRALPTGEVRSVADVSAADRAARAHAASLVGAVHA